VLLFKNTNEDRFIVNRKETKKEWKEKVTTLASSVAVQQLDESRGWPKATTRVSVAAQ
jgi:hypothetical protein